MADGNQEEKPSLFKINWSNSNFDPSLLVNTANIPTTLGRSYSQQTVLEHGRQFPKKLLSSRLRLRSQASTKGSPLGRDYLAERKLRDAVHQSNPNTLFELINQGVNICGADSKKRTALHFAAAQGNDQTLRILLENGANPNAKDLNGNTPLHLAACTNQLKIVTLLLQAGSDVNAADFSGKTPLDLAYSRLRVLQGDRNIRGKPSVYCEEVKQVIDMIKAYMLRLGNKKAEETLDQISSMLGNSATTEEMDEVHSLLSSFTAMNLSQRGGEDAKKS